MSFEELLKGRKQEARLLFERRLRGGYRGFAQEYAQRTGRYPHPHVIEKWRRGERAGFESALSTWETEQRAKQKAGLRSWKADILRQYPSPKYRVEWTDEGATIYEATTRKLTAEEQVAMLGEWKQELHKQYPERIFDVTFMKQTEGEGWKAVISKRKDVALADWRRQLTKKYPPHRYVIEWTDVGAKIYEKVTGVPTFVERGMIKAQQLEMKQYRQLTQEIVFAPPASIERGFYKAQQLEAKQVLEYMQRPAYEPKKVSEFYMTQKGLRRGVEVAPIETARAYAYYHPEKVWEAPYFYEEIRKVGKWLEAGGPTKIFREPSPARGVYFVSGAVKSVESIFRPEIRTAGGLIIQEPLGLITGRPLGEATGKYGESIRGYEPELLGELVMDFLIGKYVVGPALGKIWGKLKGPLGTIKKKIVGETIETGFERTWGAEGWHFETVKGKLGAPQFEKVPSFIRQEGMEEFFTQTARATRHPVRTRIFEDFPLRVIIKHEPKPIGGGLVSAIPLEPELLTRVALRRMSLKTLVAPYLMEAPLKTWPQTLAGVTLTWTYKGLTPTPKEKPDIIETLEISQPQMPKIEEIQEPVMSPKLAQIQALTPVQITKTIVTQIPIQKVMQTQEQFVKQAQLTKQAQIQKVSYKQVQRTMLEPPRPTTRIIRDYKPKRRKRKRGVRDPFKLYEEFVYPIATPKQFMKKVLK